MEKRKSKLSKIILTFDLILEEKLSIQENLDRVFHQVSSNVSNLKTNNENVKQRDTSNMYKYLLDVLKQLNEINCALEILEESNSMHPLVQECVKFEAKNHIEQLEETERIGTAEPSCSNLSSSLITSDATPNIDLKDAHCLESTPQSPLISELPANELEKDNYSIQDLKKSVQEISKKLGLTTQNHSDIKDYYEKCSASFQTVLPESLLSDNSVTPMNSEYFDFPEKDTNTQDQACLIDNPHSSNYSQECFEPLNNVFIDQCSENTSPFLSASGSSICTDSEIPPMNIIEKEKSQSLNNSHSNNSYTALEKLNNFRSKDVEEEENLPTLDIKLKPSGTVIQNFIPTAEKRPKKKNEERNKDNKIYKLKSKKVPEVDEECVISHIESPFEFYIHVVDDVTTTIDDLSEEIKKYYDHHTVHYISKEEFLSDVGTFCVGYVEKYHSWCRAEILDDYKNEESEEMLIRLVDFGNKILIPFKNLRKMIEKIVHVPMLAIRCHFPLLYPPESTHLNRLTTWPIETIEAMLTISGIYSYDKEVTRYFKIVYANLETNNSVAIDLYHSHMGNEGNTFGQVLIDTGLAVQIIEDYDPNNMDLERFIDDVEHLEADNINEAITGYDPRDEARICRFTKKDGTCYKGKHCKLEHVPLSKDGFTTDKEAVFAEAMYSLTIPPVGSVVNILITGYIDTCKFFGQIVNTPYNEGKYIFDLDMYLLLEEMNSPKVIKTYEPFKVSPAIGEIVIVSHWKKWMRAIVRQITTGENGDAAEIQLFMLDFGEYKKTNIKDIRKIIPRFLKLPFQAVECYIYNYQMKKNCSHKDAKKFFYKNLYFHNFTATIMSSNPPLKLDLKNINSTMVVGQILAAQGYAEIKKRDLNVADNCPLNLY